jgi:adenylate cyclase
MHLVPPRRPRRARAESIAGEDVGVSDDLISDARRALARGDVLIAYDLAREVVGDHPDDLDARFVVALSLARSGASELAGIEAAELRRRVAVSEAATPQLREDADALVARLAKDRALACGGAERAQLARDAAELYETVANRYNRAYSCVNAASLWLIGGDEDRARRLARRVLDLQTTPDDDAYWRLATEAEAALVLGDVDRARRALHTATALRPVDLGARAATRRQLRVVCEARGFSPDIAEMVELPSALHYCGHLVNGDSHEFDRVAASVADFLDLRRVGFAYGSLASGADIVIAEVLLARGIELHVVLPFGSEEFVHVSVAPAGPDWVHRFERCRLGSTSVTLATDSAYAGDDELFRYGSRIAMGHALNRAAFLGVDAEQLAVWDGQPTQEIAGTARDVEAWKRSGRATHVIPVALRPPKRETESPASESARVINAILFTDLRGFSELRDEHFPAYVRDVLGTLAWVLDGYRGSLLGYNSWGDAILAVFADVPSAARCALDLQAAIGRIETAGTDLPVDLAMRIGAHVGPVLHLREPFKDELSYWGRELTRAARIEPRTPVGEVYITDAFAALLALEPDSGIRCEYVGRVTTAKDFETIPMYRLRHA